MTPDPRAQAPAFIAAWSDYMRRAANAQDQYEALPIIHRCTTRAHKCPRCRTDVPARGECRACRRKR